MNLCFCNIYCACGKYYRGKTWQFVLACSISRGLILEDKAAVRNRAGWQSSASRGPGAPLRARNSPSANPYCLRDRAHRFPLWFLKSPCHTKEKTTLNACHFCPWTLGSSYHGRNCISTADFSQTQNLLHFLTVPWTLLQSRTPVMDRLQNKCHGVFFVNKLIQLFFFPQQKLSQRAN